MVLSGDNTLCLLPVSFVSSLSYKAAASLPGKRFHLLLLRSSSSTEEWQADRHKVDFRKPNEVAPHQHCPRVRAPLRAPRDLSWDGEMAASVVRRMPKNASHKCS
ncbi:hypothetical protein MUK42_04921 [Musa troglodytarum]|uniref:Uncharacterized protein n=1 Tax=Musa troglodytarum TaxID=320322 RepID=A0A9E7GHX6_9LILI|nr:hypothetical protein MUK42_04921 [Musa troglodytarum]